jgi:hypothetical protein
MMSSLVAFFWALPSELTAEDVRADVRAEEVDRGSEVDPELERVLAPALSQDYKNDLCTPARPLPDLPTTYPREMLC